MQKVVEGLSTTLLELATVQSPFHYSFGFQIEHLIGFQDKLHDDWSKIDLLLFAKGEQEKRKKKEGPISSGVNPQ